MTLSIAQKQNYLYVGMIIVTMIIVMFIYRTFEKKWLLFREAENKFNEQQFKEAVNLYQESLTLGPTSSQAWLHLADSYVAEGNFPEAIKWYRQYLKSYPHDINARHALARVLSWNGNIEEANREYQILLEEENETNQTP